MKRRYICCVLVLLLAAFLLPGCGIRPREPRPTREIIRELVTEYAESDPGARQGGEALLRELSASDPDAAKRWESILALWSSTETELTLSYDVLPDGLDDTEGLCLVVLGYQLAPDGSMREELIERLTVAKRCAEKYPNARIICTGGPTAYRDPNATEAGRMAQWLIQNGIGQERLIVEDKSFTTAQNAVFSFGLLEERCPQVRELAIISSDYHIATGTLLFGAEAILRGEKAGEPGVKVVSNAAWRAPSGSLPPSFQASALLELLSYK